MSFYEVVFIVRPDVATNQVEQISTKFADLIKDKGGKIIKTEQWGLKSLAYRVKKHRKGYYVMLGIEASGSVVNEVERQMRLSDDIIRFLSIRVDAMTDEPSVQMAPPRRRNDRGDRDSNAPKRPTSSRPNANPATAAE